MDGWGVHTYRLVTEAGDTKLVRWNWKTLQGKASFLWEEAQTVGGKNGDFHRQDMWNAIEAGVFPEWEVRTTKNILDLTLIIFSWVSKSWMKISS
jgi:catalase